MIDLDDTVALAEFRAQIMPLVAGCPEPLVDMGIVRAAKEYCRRTQLLTVSGVGLYANGSATVRLLDLPWDYLRPDRIITVSQDGTPMRPGVQWQAIGGGYTVELAKAPPDTAEITAEAVFAVADTATELPAALLRDHAEAIADGALAFLFTIPRKPWFDVQQAAFYAERFERKVGRQIIQSMQSYTNDSPVITRPA